MDFIFQILDRFYDIFLIYLSNGHFAINKKWHQIIGLILGVLGTISTNILKTVFSTFCTFCFIFPEFKGF
jgi:hypothetical protein